MSDDVNHRDRIPVGVLGATGIVGQRLVKRLSGHPWFRLTELLASPASAGRAYGEAVRWTSDSDIPTDVADTILRPPGEALTARILFSALEADVAEELESLYASQGHLVISNASTFRSDPSVPLLIPEVNPEALQLLGHQAWSDSGGGIVTNPNCCVVGLTLALAPLHQVFGIESVLVVTLQALSGAGLPGIPALEAFGNVNPVSVGFVGRCDSSGR